MNKLIKIHCGNGLTRGKARGYPYVVASVFGQRMTCKGRLIWYNTGERIGPMRGLKKLIKISKKYANENNLMFSEKYGSYHNMEVFSNILDYSI